MVLRYDAYDQTEDLVFTEHIGGLMRGVLCPDGGAGRVKTISCRFTGMVIPGSKIRVQMLGRITKGNHTDIFFEVLNSEGKRAVSNGIVSLSL